MDIEANKFKKFMFENLNSDKISCKTYLDLIKDYVNQDETIPKDKKQQFNLQHEWFIAVLGSFDIEIDSLYFVDKLEV